jgi:hypothetical protein
MDIEWGYVTHVECSLSSKLSCIDRQFIDRQSPVPSMSFPTQIPSSIGFEVSTAGSYSCRCISRNTKTKGTTKNERRLWSQTAAGGSENVVPRESAMLEKHTDITRRWVAQDIQARAIL